MMDRQPQFDVGSNSSDDERCNEFLRFLQPENGASVGGAADDILTKTNNQVDAAVFVLIAP
jgi:hypothetical protein